MGVVVKLWDRLTNVMSGMGTTIDKRTAGFYAFAPVMGPEAEAGYRGSWLIRKIIDIPPFDMTREWRDWQAEDTAIEAIEAEERRLQLKAKCQRALVLARLFGGSAMILGTTDDEADKPLNAKRVGKGDLAYIHVMSRYQITEGEPRLDPADPWFGQPKFYTLTSGNTVQVRLHPSRVVPFIGQRSPEGGFLPSVSWLWGDPIMQSIAEAVKNADLAQSGFASLIDRAAVDVIKLKDLMSIVGTTEGEEKVSARLAAASMGKSNFRSLVLDTEDEWAQMQVNWSGIPEALGAFLQVPAAAADIPITRLLGQSPKGLQSTGDGEERDYHSMVRARQHELLEPALDIIDEVLIRSALGNRPPDIYWEFAPLGGVTEKDAAAIEKQRAETVKLYADTGLIPDSALAAMAKNGIVESGRWPGSETAFEEAANEPDDDEQDPDQLTTLEERLAKMEARGTVTADDAKRILTDASPRSLYVSRKLLNADKVIAWAKGQGFATTVPAEDMHVTITFSRHAVDWMKMGSGWDQDADGKLKVAAGGARLVERLGDKGAIVLLFASSALSWRHEEMIRNGANHDFDEYQPHVTITYEGGDLTSPDRLAELEPYRGELIFGPEIFEEVKEDWQSTIKEA